MPKRIKKSGKPKRIFKKKAAKPMKKMVRSICKAVTQRQAEKKVTVYQTGFSVSGNTTTSGLQYYPMTPYGGYMQIAQGLGQGDRIGNNIRTVKATLKYVIYALPYSAGNNPTPIPQEVRLWFFSQKSSNTLPVTNLADFINTGNSSTSLSGTLLDLNRLVNSDVYTYLGHRTHKVFTAQFNSGAAGTTPTASFYGNNDFHFNARGTIDMTPWFPKVIKFNDSNNNPNSRLVVMLAQSINADGSVQAVGTFPTTMNFQITFKYTDD